MIIKFLIYLAKALVRFLLGEPEDLRDSQELEDGQQEWQDQSKVFIQHSCSIYRSSESCPYSIGRLVAAT